MHRMNSNRVAWSVALAALALWATSAQATFGQVMAGAARVLAQTQTEVTTTTTLDTTVDNSTTDPLMVGTEPPCLPIPQAPAPSTMLNPPAPDSAGSAQTMFRICGPDAATERAIEALIAGRGFNATLSARGDGCAELTIRPSGVQNSGSSSSRMSVSIGAGQTLTINIQSAQGATHATIGG